MLQFPTKVGWPSEVSIEIRSIERWLRCAQVESAVGTGGRAAHEHVQWQVADVVAVGLYLGSR